MKTALTLTLLAACCAPLPAQDCAKSKTEACSGSPARTSPFLDASRALLGAEKKEPPAEAPPKAAAPKTAEPAKTAARPAEKAAALPPTAEPSAGEARQEAPQAPARSNPLWTLPALAIIAGLYFYLQGGRAGRRK